MITLVQNELQAIILHEHEATNREGQLSSLLQAISLILLYHRFPVFLLDMCMIRQTVDSMLCLAQAVGIMAAKAHLIGTLGLRLPRNNLIG